MDMFKEEHQEYQSNIEDEKACARECQKNVDCDFFVYITPDYHQVHLHKNCYLKIGIENAEVVEGPGLLSSYRTCKFP